MPLNQATTVLLAKAQELDGTIDRLTTDVSQKTAALTDSQNELATAQAFKAELMTAVAKLRAPPSGN